MKTPRWYQQIGNQILAVIIVLLAASAVTAFILSNYHNYLGFQNLVYASLSNSAFARMKSMEQWTFEQREKLEILATEILPQTPSTAEEELKALLQFQAYNDELAVISLAEAETGAIRASTSPQEQGKIIFDKPWTSQPPVYRAIYPISINPMTGKPELCVALPYKKKDGGEAILLALIDMVEMGKAFQKTEMPVSEETAYLITTGPRLVFGRHSQSIPASLKASEVVSRALDGRTGRSAYLNFHGVPVFGYYSWHAAWNAAIVVEIPQSAAIYTYEGFETMVGFIAASMALAILGLGVLLSRRLTKPLEHLASAAVKIMGGDFNQRVRVSGSNEVAVAGQAFNSMMETMQNLLNALSSRERYFRSLIEHSSDFVLVLDENAVIRYASPSTLRHFGYGEKEMLGRAFEALLAEPDPGFREMLELLLKDLRGWAKAQTYWISKASGESVLVEATFNKIPRPAAEGGHSVVVNARDVSDKHKMEKDLARREKMDSLGVFSAGVADDFNNLLTGLMGYVSIFKLQIESGQRDENLLDKVEGMILRAKELTQRLVIISSGGLFHFKAQDLNDLIQFEIGELKLENRAKLELNLGTDLPPVSCDRDKVLLLLGEVFENALRFMGPTGSIAVKTDLVVRPGSRASGGDSKKEYVRVTIKDSGPGIPAEFLNQIFDPYFTTHPKAKGLGLTMVYSIMESHNGQVEVSSQPGHGTEIFLLFPPTKP